MLRPFRVLFSVVLVLVSVTLGFISTCTIVLFIYRLATFVWSCLRDSYFYGHWGALGSWDTPVSWLGIGSLAFLAAIGTSRVYVVRIVREDFDWIVKLPKTASMASAGSFAAMLLVLIGALYGLIAK